MLEVFFFNLKKFVVIIFYIIFINLNLVLFEMEMLKWKGYKGNFLKDVLIVEKRKRKKENKYLV